jgi:hypothetical protein
VGAGGAEPGEDDEPVAPAVPAVLPPPSPRRTAIGTPLTAAIADTVLEAIRARARRAGPPTAAAAAAAAAPHPVCCALEILRLRAFRRWVVCGWGAWLTIWRCRGGDAVRWARGEQ